MKRILAVFWMFALVCGLAWATGAPEAVETGPLELYLAGTPVNSDPNYAFAAQPFLDEYPDVQLIEVPIDVSDASTMSMDARLAANLPVHFYNDYYSRAGKYADPANYHPVNLADYWSAEDIADFYPDLIGPYWVDGKLTCAPWYQLIVGMQINLTVLEKVGYELPPVDEWTIDAFYEMAEAVKAAAIPEVWPTMMFAQNRSGDWHYMLWFASFGAKLFTDNDYSHTTVSSPEGLAVFEFWKDLQDRGLIPYEAAVMNDDHLINAREAGQLAAAGARLVNYNSTEAMASKVEQGLIDEPFESVFYPFPKALGVEKVPLLSTYNLHVVFDTGDERVNEIAARFAWHMSNARSQEHFCSGPDSMAVPSRKSAVVEKEGAEAALFAGGLALAQANGYFDVGGSLPVYNDIRGALFPQLQLLFSGKASPRQALELYEQALNEVVATLE